VPVLGGAISRIARGLSATLEPLAVAHHAQDDDCAALALLGLACNGHSHGPQSPEALKRRIAGCRLVIVGSYHAAVFALAQGIPAVGLVFSPYYEAKFKGLQDLFGPACRYVDARRPGWDQDLHMTAADLWTNALHWRDDLLESADRLSAEVTAAYSELRILVEHGLRSRFGAAPQLVRARAASEGA
jgi:polysaccharide pyruvyl transferase WcaK-like protein